MDPARLARSKTQRMFLLDTKESADLEWTFSVEGSTGTVYSVVIGEKSSCTCFDFKKRRETCKHIMFISTRVLKLPDVSVTMTREISESLKAIIENAKASGCPGFIREHESKPSDTCVICYEDHTESDARDFCLVCKNGFHSSCLRVWFRRQTDCPLCRSAWPKQPEQSADPMAKFFKV